MVKAATIKNRICNLAEIIRTIPGYDPDTHAEGFHFDEDRARKAIEFFHECLVHVKGEFGGKPFYLEPWEQAIVANLFGWVDDDGMRRYQKCFIYVPRKNGKTPLTAGITLYVFFCDNEPGAEVYCAAGEKEQAALLFEHARGMVEAEPWLLKNCKPYDSTKMLRRGASKYKVLTADARTKHGFNTHCAVVDELHVQQNGDLVRVLETSTSARRQPLIIYLTTADYDGPSICNARLKYAKSVRDNGGDRNKVGFDARYLPVIFEADQEKDDWTDEKVWHRVNPNLGVSKSIEYMREQCRIAKELPAEENEFKRLELNMRTGQVTRWIPMAAWDKCCTPLKSLEGRDCTAGLDLSSTEDTTCLMLLFEDGEGDEARYDVLPFFWIPEAGAREREHRDKVPYSLWATQGFIEMTPGNRVDYRYVRQRVNELASQYHLTGIGFDSWNATQLVLEMQDEDGLPMIEVRQGFASLTDPAKQLERVICTGRIRHGGNPVLRWQMDNCAVRKDPAGNIKPDKESSGDRIDGVVALVMAMALMTSPDRAGALPADWKGVEVF